MKVFVIILKVLLLILTGAVAVFFNVLGAVSTLATDVATENQIVPQVIFWLVFTVVCYIPPAFFAMFKKYILGAAFSFAGMICVLILNELIKGTANILYLPLLFITVLSILLAIFGNWDKIHDGMDNREKKKTAAAPSILGGTTKAEDKVKTVKRNKKK